MLGRAGVQLRSRGQSALAQSGEIDPRYLYPFGLGRGPSLLADPLLDFRDGTELHERLHRFVPRHADGMHMSFDEAWYYSLPSSIDHSRALADQLLNFGARTDSHKPALANGGGFDNRRFRVQGHDLPIQYHEICRRLSPSNDLSSEENDQGENSPKQLFPFCAHEPPPHPSWRT